MSGDFLFAKRCGFPAPQKRALLLDGPHKGHLHFSEYEMTRRISRRLFSPRLVKPSVQLYQPILQRDPSNTFQSGFLGLETLKDRFIDRYTFNSLVGQGILLRQFDSGVAKLRDANELLEFDAVGGKASVSTGHLVGQTYDLQAAIQKNYVGTARDSRAEARYNTLMNSAITQNTSLAKAYRKLGERKTRSTNT